MMDNFDEKLKARADREGSPVPEGFDGRLAKKLEHLPERKRRRFGVVRWIAVAAAVVCLLMAGAYANYDDPDGAYYDEYGHIHMPELGRFTEGSVEENGRVRIPNHICAAELVEEDGRIMLYVQNGIYVIEEVLDITEELAENGTYHYERTEGDYCAAVDIYPGPYLPCEHCGVYNPDVILCEGGCYWWKCCFTYPHGDEIGECGDRGSEAVHFMVSGYCYACHPFDHYYYGEESNPYDHE